MADFCKEKNPSLSLSPPLLWQTCKLGAFIQCALSLEHCSSSLWRMLKTRTKRTEITSATCP